MWKSFVIELAEAPAGIKVNNINTTETEAIIFKVDFLFKSIFYLLFLYYDMKIPVLKINWKNENKKILIVNYFKGGSKKNLKLYKALNYIKKDYIIIN